MGRKSKCTVEEKISAVEDYLNGIKTISEIMGDLSISSTQSVRAWILAYQQRGIEALYLITKNNYYTKEFKSEPHPLIQWFSGCFIKGVCYLSFHLMNPFYYI